MTQEALKLVFEALQYVVTPSGGTRAHVWDSSEARLVADAYRALEKALAQHDSVQAKPEPEQEPVGALTLGGIIDTSDGPEYEEWDIEWNSRAIEALQERLVTGDPVTLEIYTSPPQRTEQEPWCMKMNGCKTKCEDCPVEVTEQEPVGYATKEDFYHELERRLKHIREEMKIKSVTMRCKEYDIALPIIDTDFGRVLVGQVSTPPQRTWERPWVSLTDEEKQEWIDAMPYDPQPRHCMTLVNIIESKLKEKNGYAEEKNT